MPTIEYTPETMAILSALKRLRQEVRDLRNSGALADLTKLRYLTLREAAIYLRLTPDALETRLRRGAVPSWCYSRMGGSLRFIRASLDEWLGADGKSQQLAKKSSG